MRQNSPLCRIRAYSAKVHYTLRLIATLLSLSLSQRFLFSAFLPGAASWQLYTSIVLNKSTWQFFFPFTFFKKTTDIYHSLFLFFSSVSGWYSRSSRPYSLSVYVHVNMGMNFNLAKSLRFYSLSLCPTFNSLSLLSRMKVCAARQSS